MRAIIPDDYIGKIYGRLIIVEYVERKKGHHYFKCMCSCGNEKIVNLCDLKRNHTRSCGCIKKELIKARSTKHGFKHNKFYITYYGMMGRCYNPKHKQYKYWGGRGIAVCDEWLDKGVGVQRYISWCERNFIEGCSIDRIDNDKGYSPENCRFATPKEQNNNSRLKHNSVLIQYNDKVYPEQALSKLLGFGRTLMNHHRGKKGKQETEEFFKKKYKIEFKYV